MEHGVGRKQAGNHDRRLQAEQAKAEKLFHQGSDAPRVSSTQWSGPGRETQSQWQGDDGDIRPFLVGLLGLQQLSR